MAVNIEKKDSETVVSVVGRLDTVTAPDLEKELKAVIGNTAHLILNFAKLDYISSAGLRVVLTAQKTITQNKGSMSVINVNEAVMEIFDITGFSDILTIQ